MGVGAILVIWPKMYAVAKFEVIYAQQFRSCIYKKYIIWPLTLTLGL